MVVEKKINDCTLYYFDESSKYYFTMMPFHYYFFIKKRLERVLERIPKKFSISLGDTGVKTDIKIGFQVEHQIYEDKTTGSYYPFFNNYEPIYNNDIIIEASSTNFESCKLHVNDDIFLKKLIYIPSLIYDFPKLGTNSERIKDVVSCHHGNERRDIINKKYNIDSVGTYDFEQIRKIYQNYKILINVHQTHNLSSMEDLRIWPALMNGILIVSEVGPLVEKTSYYNHIIWTKYDSIIDTVTNVLSDYDRIKQKHHENLSQTLQKVSDEIDLDFYNKIKEILS
jgi:hypothetical protein